MIEHLHSLLGGLFRRRRRPRFEDLLHEARFGSDPVSIRVDTLERVLSAPDRKSGRATSPNHPR